METSSNIRKDRSVRLMDQAGLALVLAAALAMSLFPIVNNDIWWHMAVAREILEKRSFPASDPFSFATYGRPWVPHSYLADLFLYLVYRLLSAPGLIAWRAMMVLATFTLTARILRTRSLPYVYSAPFLVLAMISIQTRFLVRPHLIELLFPIVLLGMLLRPKRKGKSYFVLAALLQVVWVNTHPSFYLGPMLAAMFLVGDGLGAWLGNRTPFVAHPGPRWKGLRFAGVLVLVLIAASFVNPRPYHFIMQPLVGEQRELVSTYIMEWRSPFDSAVGDAPFRPYYEMVLASVWLLFAFSVRRMQAVTLLAAIAFTLLSLEAHRFRVELALIALPLVLLQVKESGIMEVVAGKLRFLGRTALPRAAGIAATLAVVAAGRGFFELDGAVAARYPDEAFDFVVENGVAKRPFHSIGFGSYLLWKIYPERMSFIDGRNYAPDLYRDFLLCQRDGAGLREVSSRYALDAFILPEPSACDPGMRNIHRILESSKGWSLVHVDGKAYVYVRNSSVPLLWLNEHRYALYRPLSFGPSAVRSGDAEALIAELLRATSDDPLYAKAWMDLGTAFVALDRPDQAARAFEKAVSVEPANPSLRHNLGVAYARARRMDRAREAFAVEEELDPKNPRAPLALAMACEALGDTAGALAAYERALALDEGLSDAYRSSLRLLLARGDLDEALRVAWRYRAARPLDHRSSLEAARVLLALGRPGEALESARAAARMEDRSADVHLLLARIHLALGDTASSEREASRALALEPGNEEALRILEGVR